MFANIIRNHIPITVCTLIFCIFGLLAVLRIPVQMIPDIEARIISVKTRWPGATPQDIEKEILIEQEEYLRNIPYLEELQSTALFGSAVIELKFPHGTDLTKTLIEVNNALTQVPSYPENVDEPVVAASSLSASSFIFLRVSPLEGNPRNLDMDMMRDYVEDNVRPRMSNLPGVALVEVAGGAERQIQVHLDPAKLIQYGLNVVDVRNAIRNRSKDFSAGKLEDGKQRYLIRTVGRLSSIEEIEGLVLRNKNNSVLRLSDVATVTFDHQVIEEKAFINGAPVILLSLKRESGSNVLKIKQAVLKEVHRINDDLLTNTGMQIHLTSDDVSYVQDSIHNVWKNLLLGAALATFVMFLFFRSWHLTSIAVVGIPICCLAAFVGLMIAGRSVNVISLAGIAFAVGMTLDNSVVVLESILQQRDRGYDNLKASIQGVKQVWPSVMASTFTTVLVFLPVIFITEEAGQLYSDIAISISASIIASMVIALTLVPMASTRYSATHSDHNNFNSTDKLNQILQFAIQICTSPRGHRLAPGICLVSVILITVFLLPSAEYLPEGEEPKVFAVLSAPSGYNLGTMEELGEELNTWFQPYIGANPQDFAKGTLALPPVRYINMRITPEKLRIVAEPVAAGQVDELMDALAKKFNTYTSMKAFVSRGSIISSNDGGTRSINLNISGASLEELFKVAQVAYARTFEIFDQPRVKTNPSSLHLTQPLIQVEPNWERAAELELSIQDIGFTVAALTDGAWVNAFYFNNDKVDLYLYNKHGPGGTLELLSKIMFNTPASQPIPLTDIVQYRQTVDTSSIRRLNGQRTVTLNIIPPESIALEDGVNVVREDLLQYLRARNVIPVGVTLNLSGAADQLDATKQALRINYFVAAIIIYLLMVAIFSNWGYPILIMLTIPLGFAGGIAGLAIFNGMGSICSWLGTGGFHQSMDMITLLGFLILMGTVVNNPILILHQSVENCFKHKMLPSTAVVNALQARFRAIAISTLTTVIGICPLVFNPGAGSELYRGVGVIVMSGIIGSTLVTLFVLPALTINILEWMHARDLQNNKTKAYV